MILYKHVHTGRLRSITAWSRSWIVGEKCTNFQWSTFFGANYGVVGNICEAFYYTYRMQICAYEKYINDYYIRHAGGWKKKLHTVHNIVIFYILECLTSLGGERDEKKVSYINVYY